MLENKIERLYKEENLFEIYILKDKDYEEVIYHNNEEMSVEELAEDLYSLIKLYNKNIKFTENEDEMDNNNTLFYGYDCIIINLNNKNIFSYHYDFSSYEEIEENFKTLINILN